jgi:uncharacterized repeat protein (TIGR01451 family)
VKRSKIPLVLLLALFSGALLGVAFRKSNPTEVAEAQGKATLRMPRALSAHEAGDDEDTDAAGLADEHFQKIPRAARGSVPDVESPSAALLTPEEVKARKLAALEEILGTINTFPGLDDQHRDSLARYAMQFATADTPRVQCWSPDTPPEVVFAYQRVEKKIAEAGGMSLQALQVAAHWTRTATNGTGQGTQGQPVTIRWSIVPDGTPIPATDSGESSDPSNLRARMAAIYGGSATGDPAAQPWFSVFQAVFDNLAAVSGLRFVYEPNDDGVTIDGFTSSSDWGVTGTRGDIRISGHSIDGNSNVLAYAYYPDNGDVVIDTNDSYIATISNNSIRLRNIMEHEIGHSLGLDHVCPVNQTKLMEPFISTAYRGSQFDDVLSQQRNYGDPLEVHGALRNNDSSANATALGLAAGTTSTWEWLSIDDSSDSDFFSFPATTLQQVTVRIIPSDPILPADPNTDTYLEGSQNVDGSCSAGTAFDPTTQQDLILDLLGTNGSTVVASAVVQPAGDTEAITAFQLPANGTHYIRVRGGSADRAQLYRMEVLLADVPPAPRVTITSTRLDAESNSGENGAPDPGETIRLGISLSNEGNLPATNLTATLSAPVGSTLFEASKSYGSLATGASGEQLFTFALAGSPGQVIPLALTLSASGYSEVLPLSLTLGTTITDVALEQHFDTSSSLPPGWSQSVSGAGSAWVVSSTSFSSAPNAAFSPSISPNGEALLVSPSITIGQDGGALEFLHRYELELRSDGGVLEASRNGGAWFDLLNSDATVEAGDYNNTIRSNSSSAIKGRETWTGSAGSFLSTRVELPAIWAGEAIVFRWRLVHNSATTLTGWYVDDVRFSSAVSAADPFRPFVSLTASDSGLGESDPLSPVNLTLTTPLPLVQEVSVTLDVSGSADATDVEGLTAIVLPAGQTSASIAITAKADGLAEGLETLGLAIPPAAGGFAAAAPSSVSIAIADTAVQPATVTLSNLSTTFDGTAKSATVMTDPAGLAVSVTYDGSALLPVDAGTYAVVATVTEPGYSGSASGSFVIVSAYTAWISTFTDPENSEATADGDLDLDGWDNAGEYALGTSPVDPASLPVLEPVLTQDTMRLLLPPAPAGIDRVAETSTDLEAWSTEGVTAIEGGYEVPRSAGRRYLRIVYEVVN